MLNLTVPAERRAKATRAEGRQKRGRPRRTSNPLSVNRSGRRGERPLYRERFLEDISAQPAFIAPTPFRRARRVGCQVTATVRVPYGTSVVWTAPTLRHRSALIFDQYRSNELSLKECRIDVRSLCLIDRVSMSDESRMRYRCHCDGVVQGRSERNSTRKKEETIFCECGCGIRGEWSTRFLITNA